MSFFDYLTGHERLRDRKHMIRRDGFGRWAWGVVVLKTVRDGLIYGGT